VVDNPTMCWGGVRPEVHDESYARASLTAVGTG